MKKLLKDCLWLLKMFLIMEYRGLSDLNQDYRNLM